MFLHVHWYTVGAVRATQQSVSADICIQNITSFRSLCLSNFDKPLLGGRRELRMVVISRSHIWNTQYHSWSFFRDIYGVCFVMEIFLLLVGEALLFLCYIFVIIRPNQGGFTWIQFINIAFWIIMAHLIFLWILKFFFFFFLRAPTGFEFVYSRGWNLKPQLNLRTTLRSSTEVHKEGGINSSSIYFTIFQFPTYALKISLFMCKPHQPRLTITLHYVTRHLNAR